MCSCCSICQESADIGKMREGNVMEKTQSVTVRRLTGGKGEFFTDCLKGD